MSHHIMEMVIFLFLVYNNYYEYYVVLHAFIFMLNNSKAALHYRSEYSAGMVLCRAGYEGHPVIIS